MANDTLGTGCTGVAGRTSSTSDGEARFRAAAESMLDAFFILKSVRGADGRIADFAFSYLNRNAERLLGLDRAAVLERRLCEMLPGYRANGLFDRYVQVAHTRQPIEEEILLGAPEADAGWLQHQIVPLGDGVAITARGISERKRMEAELRLSEARLRALADNSPLSMFLKDAQGRYLLVNREFERTNRISQADIQGKTAHEVYRPEHADLFVEHDRQVLAEQATVQRELQLQTEGGVETVVSTKFPVLGCCGEIVGIGCFETYITDRKRAEDALRESEMRFRTLADSVPALLWMSDEHGECIFVNMRWLEFTGRAMRQVLGHGFADDIHPEDRPNCLAIERVTFAAREVYAMDYRLRGADGQYRWFLDTGTPRFTPEGVYLGYIGILVDITERRELEAEVSTARDLAESASRAKSQFLAHVSHELRTPLNAIIGFSDILQSELFGPLGSSHYKEYSCDIHDSGTHLLAVINDILDLSKIEAGRFELNEEVCELGALVASAIRFVRDRAQAAGLTLKSRVPAGLPRLRADGRAIKQILLNLLSNAVKFTPRGGSILVELELDAGGAMTLGVHDTGIGIRSEDIPKALEPFGQIDSTFSRKYEGTGLGLPLTKGLADLHGAKFELDSEPGRGTTVRVRFPSARLIHRPAGAAPGASRQADNVAAGSTLQPVATVGAE